MVKKTKIVTSFKERALWSQRASEAGRESQAPGINSLLCAFTRQPAFHFQQEFGGCPRWKCCQTAAPQICWFLGMNPSVGHEGLAADLERYSLRTCELAWAYGGVLAGFSVNFAAVYCSLLSKKTTKWKPYHWERKKPFTCHGYVVVFKILSPLYILSWWFYSFLRPVPIPQHIVLYPKISSFAIRED